MSQTQAALDEFAEDEPEHEPTTCECCGSADIIPHMPLNVSEDGVELSDEPRVCWSCAGGKEHWQAREDARTRHMPDEPWSNDAKWGVDR